MKRKTTTVVGLASLCFLLALSGLATDRNNILEINGDIVDVSRSSTERIFTNFSPQVGEVIITDIDSSGFPVIKVYVDVLDVFGVLMCGLTEEDFCVFEDGEPVDFEVSSLDTVPCPISICLVMDISGSMSEEPLQHAKEAAVSFVRSMGPDGRAAIVTYSSCVETLQAFTSDTALLINAIGSLTAEGLTAMFDGYWLGVDLTCSEPGVRAVIGFTDGQENHSQFCWPPPNGAPEGDDWQDDCDTVSSYAQFCRLPIYSIGVGPYAWGERLICLAEQTGGQFYYAPGAEDLDSIYQEIQGRLCCRYLITYTSPDTVQDCEVHQVIVCEGGVLCTPCDTGYYHELCPPVLKRTPPTIALSDTCQTPGEDLVIEAWAVDTVPPPVQDVWLYWRITGSDPYTEVTMTHMGDSLYSARILGSELPMGTPGVDYYLKAWDGELTVWDPPQNPETSPYRIEICPNEPPVIEDVWYVEDSCAYPETPFPIMCQVFDTTDYVDSVYLFYRPAGETSYEVLLMSDQGAGQYLGVVPGSSVGTGGFEYYIRAVDNYGLDSYYGDSVSPHYVPTCDNEPPVITAVWYPADSCVVPDSDFVIMCEVFDTTDWVSSVFLSYRRGGEVVYQITEMQDQGGDQYLGVVPGSFAGPTGIDYFIRAVDNWGLSGFYGSAADPVHVDTCPHEPGPLVRVPPDTCVYPGEPNCIPVYLDGLPPWEVTSVQMVLLYDESVIQATQATTVNSIAEAWGEPTCSVSPGEILIDMGGTPALDATGVLVWVCFEVIGEVGETSLLEFEDDSASLGGSNVWAREGTVRVCPRGIAVDLDIKPRSCPNPLNTSGGAPPVARLGGEDLDGDIIDPPASELGESVLPVAILGANDFEASTIDPNSVRLEGVSPLRWSLEDVAAPVESDDTCECTTAGPDGYDDLALKFIKREVLNALEAQAPFADREIRVLTITGMTWDGTPIEGHDCVVIIHNNYFETNPLRGYGLRENYPNPFNPQTDISFTLPERARVTLIVYNVAGKKVKTLIAGEMEAGTYTVRWNGTDQVGNRVASGIYLCRMEVGGSSQTMKMVLMK